MTRSDKIKALQAITTGQAHPENLMPQETHVYWNWDETPESKQETRAKIARIEARNKHRPPDNQHLVIVVNWPEGD